MTATNHALTGAVIALIVKQPLLAIPLAFISHFLLDTIPHYNPPGVKKENFTDFESGWAKKLSHRSFKLVFSVDMFLFVLVLVFIPLAAPPIVSSWTVFLSALAAASPDFAGGRFLIYRVLKIMPEKSKKVGHFTKFHIAMQWMERPWGLAVEVVWFFLMLSVALSLIT